MIGLREDRMETAAGQNKSGRAKRPGAFMKALLQETRSREIDDQLAMLEELKTLRSAGRENSRRAMELRLEIAKSEQRMESADAVERRVFPAVETR